MTQNNREIGTRYEAIASEFLQKAHVRIVANNYRTRFGEIDLIGYDGAYLVFFEIKYRKTALCGTAAEAVTKGKQRTICRVSDYYRLQRGIGEFTPIRYDVIGIDKDEIQWIKNAFDYIR